MDDPKDDKSKPGPEEERLKLDGDWEDAVKKAMDRPRPEDGWPDPDAPEKEGGEPESDDEQTPAE